MQKMPAGGQPGQAGGEWFTSPVDIRATEALKSKLGEGQEDAKAGSLLEMLAAKGDKFGKSAKVPKPSFAKLLEGHATAVAMQSTAVPSSSHTAKIPKLSDTVIRRASLKFKRWKEQLAMSRAGGFGSITRAGTRLWLGLRLWFNCCSVGIPLVASTSFTPCFAPTHDSAVSTGGVGYYATLQARHERARHQEWSRRVSMHQPGAGSRELDDEGWWGTLEAEQNDEPIPLSITGKGKGKEVEDILTENAEWIEELQAWQMLRLRRGDASWIGRREERVGKSH